MKNKFYTSKKAIALIMVILAMLVCAILGATLAFMHAGYLMSGLSFRRVNQVEFICDAGLDRGKELIADSYGKWRPPNPPGYLREHMTIEGAKGHYDIYVEDLGGGRVKLIVSAQIEEE